MPPMGLRQKSSSGWEQREGFAVRRGVACYVDGATEGHQALLTYGHALGSGLQP